MNIYRKFVAGDGTHVQVDVDGNRISLVFDHDPDASEIRAAIESRNTIYVNAVAGGVGPKGDTGPQGPQGIQGPAGPQGPKGDKGDTGSTGAQGLQGEAGLPGEAGPQGLPGAKGDKGDTGLQGETGLQGPKGDKGDTGAQGLRGEQGLQGLQGLKGDKGDKGDTGDTGPQGPAGDLSGAWPIGSVFIGAVSTNPNTLLGIGTWTQIAQGQMIVGYKSGDADFGTLKATGGAKTGTPAGTVSQPTFTGDQLANHQHAAISAGTPAGTVGAISATQGTAVKVGTSGASAAANTHTHPAPTFTGNALGTHQHNAITAGTPSGTVSQPDFTGDSMSIINPYLVLYVWERTA